ncbi:MAG: hypothetical protein JST54_29300 [Deltaproteobacteria bacterium]|nr:hypothetical protein [Deltaproteobacteria bacterium]
MRRTPQLELVVVGTAALLLLEMGFNVSMRGYASMHQQLHEYPPDWVEFALSRTWLWMWSLGSALAWFAAAVIASRRWMIATLVTIVIAFFGSFVAALSFWPSLPAMK